MQSLKIAFRNVSRQRKRGLLLGGAVAFGFFIFTLVNGFTGGLLGTVEGNIAGALGGHIYVSGSEVSERGSEISVIRDTGKLEQALAVIRDQIASTNTRSSANVSIVFGSREEPQQLVGVDFGKENDVLDNLAFTSGSAQAFLADDRAILLPAETVAKLRVEVGESVIVKTTTVNGQQNVGDFKVVGSLQTQDGFGFSSGYADIGTLNTLLDMSPNQYQTLNIYLKDLGQLEPATAALHEELARVGTVKPRETPGGPDLSQAFGLGRLTSVDVADRWSGTRFETTNLTDITAQVATLVGLMQAASLGIFLVIVGIIMVGITNSYRMVMIERTAEIGTMRALGVQRAGIRNIFVWEALFVALGGALAGLVVAFVVMGGVGLLDLGSSPFSFFLDQGHVRFATTLPQILSNVALLCALSAAAVYLPARAAANLKPAEALRA